jgi:hypothetical protein
MGARMFTPMLRFGAVVLGSAAALWVQAASAPMPVIYPAKGQSPAQMDQDKYACFQWGKAQSGFDPMQPQQTAAPQAQPTPTAAAPMTGSMVKGAAGGAAVAELANGDAGKGAAVGVLGAAVREQLKKQQSGAQASQQQQQQQAQMQAARAQQRATFERAFGACLEGRGYVVK